MINLSANEPRRLASNRLPKMLRHFVERKRSATIDRKVRADARLIKQRDRYARKVSLGKGQMEYYHLFRATVPLYGVP